jgi:hypothetical protein
LSEQSLFSKLKSNSYPRHRKSRLPYEKNLLENEENDNISQNNSDSEGEIRQNNGASVVIRGSDDGYYKGNS